MNDGAVILLRSPDILAMVLRKCIHPPRCSAGSASPCSVWVIARSSTHAVKSKTTRSTIRTILPFPLSDCEALGRVRRLRGYAYISRDDVTLWRDISRGYEVMALPHSWAAAFWRTHTVAKRTIHSLISHNSGKNRPCGWWRWWSFIFARGLAHKCSVFLIFILFGCRLVHRLQKGCTSTFLAKNGAVV